MKVYYPSEVAAILQTSYKKVKKWMDDGELTYTLDKNGRRCCSDEYIKEFAFKKKIDYILIPGILSSKDVAERFGVSERTIIRWEKKGKLRPRKTPGGRKYYYIDDISNIPFYKKKENIDTSSLTDAELAVLHGVSERTIQNWKRKGKL